MSGTTKLLDIRGTGSALALSSSGNYQFCIVHVAGECYTGSTVGEVYANFPSLPTYSCKTSESGVVTLFDWCIANAMALAHGFNQYGLKAGNRIGTESNGKPVYGMEYSRKLGTGLFMWPRQSGGLGILGPRDGQWLYHEDGKADPYTPSTTENANGADLSEVYLLKVPPQPPNDGIDRTNYLNVTVTIGAGPSGAGSAKVRYGYEENESPHGTTWPPVIHYYCTQYQGECDTACTTGLSANHSYEVGVPQRVLYYQREYYSDSSYNGTALSSDPMQAVVSDYSASSLAPGVLCLANPVSFDDHTC